MISGQAGRVSEKVIGVSGRLIPNPNDFEGGSIFEEWRKVPGLLYFVVPAMFLRRRRTAIELNWACPQLTSSSIINPSIFLVNNTDDLTGVLNMVRGS